MESISPIPWHEFATKDDISALKKDVEDLKEYVDTKFEVQSVVAKAQFSEIQAQFVTLEGNLSKRLSKQSWLLSVVFGGFAASVLTAIAAGAPFG